MVIHLNGTEQTDENTFMVAPRNGWNYSACGHVQYEHSIRPLPKL